MQGSAESSHMITMKSRRLVYAQARDCNNMLKTTSVLHSITCNSEVLRMFIPVDMKL